MYSMDVTRILDNDQRSFSILLLNSDFFSMIFNWQYRFLPGIIYGNAVVFTTEHVYNFEEV